MSSENTIENGHPDRWRILAVLCAALCIVVLDNTILSVAIPSIGDELGADETGLQWITAAYPLVLAALLLPLAGLGDRFGRKGLLLVGVGLFGVSSAGAALAATSGQLVLGRGLMGFAGAAAMPATLSILSNVFPEHERARAIALWSGVSSVAAAAGPLVGGFLLDHFWWGSVFLVNVPVTAAVFLAAVKLVPTSRDPSAPPIDVAGSVAWSVALGAGLFALIEGGERGFGPIVVAAGATAAVALAAFAAWERRCPHPLLSPAAVADRRMQAGMVAVPATFFCILGTQFVLTQWLQGVRDLSPLEAGLCFVPHAAAVLVGSLLSTRLVARVGLGRAASVGLVVLAFAMAIGAVLHGSVPPVLLAVTVAGLGVGLACPPAVELIMGSVPPEQAGQAAGVNETIVEAGGALGVAVMGTILAVAAGGVGGIAPEHLSGPEASQARAAFTDALAAPLVWAIVLALAAAAFVAAHVRGTAAAAPPDPAAVDAMGPP